MHDVWQERIAYYVAGTLPPDETRALEQHLSQCASCRQAVAEWQAIASAVRAEAGQWSRRLPPLSAEVRAEVQQPRHPQLVPRPMSAEAPPRIHRRGLAPLTALAAALMVVLFAALLAFLSNRNHEPDITEVAMLSIVTMTNEPDATEKPDIRITPDEDLGILAPTNMQGAAASRTPIPPLSTPVTDPQTGALLTPMGTTSPPLSELSQPSGVCNVSTIGGSTVTLYQQADQNSAIVGSIGPDTPYVTYTQSENGWYQIIQIGPGLLGWVPGSQLSLTGDCTSLPLPTPTQRSTICEGRLVVPQIAMRGGPGDSYAEIGTVREADVFEVIAESDNYWFRLQLTSGPSVLIGWVPVTAIRQYGVCSGLPLVPSAGYDPQVPQTPVPTTTVAPATARGAITSFTSSVETVTPSGSVTIQWTTSNASGVWLEYFGVNMQTGESSAEPIERLPNASTSGGWTVTIPAGFAYDGARFVIIVDNYDNGLGIPRAELVVRVIS
jgi:hypothetical protein